MEVAREDGFALPIWEGTIRANHELEHSKCYIELDPSAFVNRN